MNDFLIKNSANTKKESPTHTRIGDKQRNIYGGSYHIDEKDMDTFYNQYHQKVFVTKMNEFLTEKQLTDDRSPVAVDFDFRYNTSVVSRQHDQSHILDMVMLYLEELKQFFVYDTKKDVPIYVMEKPNVNKQEDKTKDGIHMIIGHQMHHVLQERLREKILEKLPDMWGDLPLTNSWDSVLDEGITKGSTNWQLYGSKKPGNESYQITYYFVAQCDPADNEWSIDQRNVSTINLEKDLSKISVRYPNHTRFCLKSDVDNELSRLISKGKTKTRTRHVGNARLSLLPEDEDGAGECDEYDIPMSEVTSKEILEMKVKQMINSFTSADYKAHDAHQMTQILPGRYYEPGSHSYSIKVALALKDTDRRLFWSWVQLRSKAADFDFASIPDLYNKWVKYIGRNQKSEDRVTHKSMMYWAKNDAPDDYEKIQRLLINKYIEDTISSPSDFDFAMVLYVINRDRFLSTNIAKKTEWYKFTNNIWKFDGGESLRLSISREMHSVYQHKISQFTDELRVATESNDQEEVETAKKKIKYVSELQLKLKKTSDKNNIMREAQGIFYDEMFDTTKDTNKYLLACNNGVVDFKNKCFRAGHPNDYNIRTTGLDYRPIDNDKDKETVREIESFMRQLFPEKELCRYMWEHLASVLIGTNMNQTFNIYRGSGSNGKSKLVELMHHCLGEYVGTAPISLVTDKRPAIGGTSSEIIALRGLRYAVMQEPSKGMKLNEGMMKELTGGDKIQARGLYAGVESFYMQASLCVCTNSLFEIDSNDDGTWRRIRVVDFKSKFVDRINEDDKETPQFLKDTTLDDKLPVWAPIFLSMLIEKAFLTDGKVNDCDSVLSASKQYRQGQDHLEAFVTDTVVVSGDNNDVIKKRMVYTAFKSWFLENEGTGRKMPKGAELNEYMDTRFGKCKASGWHGVKLKTHEEEDDLAEALNQNAGTRDEHITE